MQLEKTLVFLSLATYGAAENDVDASDVPSECLPACQFTIDLSARCDRETDDDDTYTPCVCNAPDSRRRLTECASCIRDYDSDSDSDNDVADLMDDCGWNFDDADGPYPTGSTTTVTSPSSTSSDTATVTVTQTPSGTTRGVSSTPATVIETSGITTETRSQTPSDTTTVLVEPSTTPTVVPDNMAGALNAKAAVGPLVAGLLVGLPVLL
ncbi:hypothetical protein F5B22DRAFT_536330 [Xylaria bambusicola]|uniref:uncharacterized protein n=1 Tax=Xylaria bambusicola TaxID=326684 RepID=UPI0020072287|nr:uncharacterized protein F5B22DRAFT_536330 [Xylaria bambusicola]KAI0505176.1 hypothetical protein F5B22DRAFT_536330 [Xylaria bambusicola]